MRLQTYSGSTKKRDRPSEQPSNSEEDGSAPYPPNSVRTLSSLSIKVDGAGSPGLIRPPPSSQQSQDTYSKRQSRASNRKHSASRSGVNEVDPQYISHDTQQQGDGKSNFNRKRHHDPDDLGYRKDRSKTKPNNNNRKFYSSSNHLGKIDDGQIPVISWIVILSILGLAFYHIRKAFIIEGMSSSRKKGKDRLLTVRYLDNHAKRGRRTQRQDEEQEDINVVSLLESKTVNKKKNIVKPKRSVAKKSQDMPPPSFVEEKLSGGESPDSASTDGSSSGSAVKRDKDESKTSSKQVPLSGKSLENIAPLALPREISDQQPLDVGEWCQAKSRGSRKVLKPLGVSSDDEKETTETATTHVVYLASSPPSLADPLDGKRQEIPVDIAHTAECKISDEKISLEFEDSPKDKRENEMVSVDTVENSNSSVEVKDSPIDLVRQEPVTPIQSDRENIPQDQVVESHSTSTDHSSSSVEDADRLLATLLQSQEEASVVKEDISKSIKEMEWEEVSTKKKKR